MPMVPPGKMPHHAPRRSPQLPCPSTPPLALWFIELEGALRHQVGPTSSQEEGLINPFCPKAARMEGIYLCPDRCGDTGELLPEQDLHFLIRAASDTHHRSASGGLRLTCGRGGVLECDRDRPDGSPETAGKGEGRSASPPLSSQPLLHCGLMAQEGGREGRKPPGAVTGPTSCLSPRKGKVPSESS